MMLDEESKGMTSISYKILLSQRMISHPSTLTRVKHPLGLIKIVPKSKIQGLVWIMNSKSLRLSQIWVKGFFYNM